MKLVYRHGENILESAVGLKRLVVLAVFHAKRDPRAPDGRY
jgi:hypothetical protein